MRLVNPTQLADRNGYRNGVLSETSINLHFPSLSGEHNQKTRQRKKKKNS